MPTYLYKCVTCGVEAEFEHRMTESPKITCTKCIGRYNNPGLPMARQCGYKPGVSFRGSGFHTNDDPSARVPR